MIKVGLTGGMGSGKSTVANLFHILGVEIYSSDAEAKRLMLQNEILKAQIRELIGDESYVQNKLNKKFIASRVFSEPTLLEKLNALVHPIVRMDFINWAEERKSKNYVIQESALLFESGIASSFDYTILVTAGLEQRIERIIRRDASLRSDVLARINQQMSDEEKLKLADFHLNNSGDKLLIPQVLELHNKFVSLQNKFVSD